MKPGNVLAHVGEPARNRRPGLLELNHRPECLLVTVLVALLQGSNIEPPARTSSSKGGNVAQLGLLRR
jgi:hypothetical protein